MSKWANAIALSALIAVPAAADGFGLGRPATDAEITAWDIDIRPDGAGLPVGQGTPLEGEELYNDRCASCHGVFGEGAGRWPVLVGGDGTLTEDRPVKTVGSYWPYASTVWDYVHRAMPFGAAQSLEDDEVYALTAYILYMNDVIDDEEFALSNESFAEIKMPNAGGFIADDRPDMMTLDKGEPCMSDCTGGPVKVTMRAQVLDVTPDGGGGEGGTEAEVAAEVEEPIEVVVIDAELAAAGKKVFRKCKACHKIGDGAKSGVGPILNGIVGRGAGQIEGFRYSKAMTKASADELVWTAEALSGYLEAPKKFMKGTKMTFGGLRKEGDRLAVIEYLKQF